MWKISIHRDFDSLGGPLSPCGSHWLRLGPFTQIRSRTLWVPMNPQQGWRVDLESAYSLMVQYWKNTVCGGTSENIQERKKI